MDYPEALQWAYGLQRTGIKLGLKNTRALMQAMGVPAKPAEKVFHVAGTNGKGSVCAMLSALCQAAGLKTGLYTSPHLVTFRERIRVDGEMIPRKAAADLLSEARSAVEAWEHPPTFFEVVTVAALRYFTRLEVQACILETGLGGRLDSTNACEPDICVITPIGMDHQDLLGETLEQIAGEKAGIIKPGIPVLSARQAPDAAAALCAAANAKGANLRMIEGAFDGPALALPGAHQRENARLAVEAFRASGLTLGEGEISATLAAVRWPARFESHEAGRIILDGAHNPHAGEALVAAWREKFGSNRATVLIGMMADKDCERFLRVISPISARWIPVQMASPRALAPGKLSTFLQKAVSGSDCLPHATLAKGLETARAFPEPVLITGSLYLAGEYLALSQSREADGSPSLQ